MDDDGRLRVARVITRLNVGGPAIQALTLTARLDPARFRSVLYCGVQSEREGDIRDLRGDLGVRPISLPDLQREISPGADLRTILRLIREFRRFRPHIVHTHLSKAGLVGRVAARLSGVPVVIHTFHGTVFRAYFGSPGSWLLLQLEKMLARGSTRVVAISPRQMEEIRGRGIASEPRLVQVPLGLDLAPYLDPPHGALRRELGIAAGVPVVTIVARLVPIKGVDVFLDAVARVVRRHRDVMSVIVGDGSERDALERRAQALGVADRVRFLGWRADLAAIYADSDVVVLTSRNEGTPVSVIEALAAARAVVATQVGGVADILSECGVLVPDGDVTAIADAVSGLIEDEPRRVELGQLGRLRVYPAYDSSVLIRRVEDLYEEAAGQIRVRR